MKGFTATQSGARAGINCQKHAKGFWFIPLGEDGRGRTLTRVPVGGKFSSSLVQEKDGEEELTLFECGVIRTKEKGTLLVVEGQPEDKRALVQLYCYEGFRGSNSYELGEGVTELARGTHAQGDAGRMGSGDEILVVMEPGSKIKAHRTGRTYGAPGKFVFLFTGEGVEVMTPEEEIECVASFQEEAGEAL